MRAATRSLASAGTSGASACAPAELTLGHPPSIRAEPFWTDCALLDRAGIPCVLFGADGEGAHADTEYVDLASLDHLTDILTDTITEFCS
ncbi:MULTISPECIES: M20/M25/M40 family metallo-hydrolase [unclassified Streptomyces]|uniref:M20/M25/M40 family metallo-hydrolase n=1 Tax=unclassified Streptomyces TaxID=2593676 RepID=UPI001EFDED17|nr:MULTISPECIES: M20/M25/M40 family metallo-hydrolase [unclassified Streptomyces]